MSRRYFFYKKKPDSDESGFEKLHGTNWFADLTFPFPFNLLPPDVSWAISTFFASGAKGIAAQPPKSVATRKIIRFIDVPF